MDTTTHSNSAGSLLPPNHHSDHPGFSGVGAWLAGLTMIAGRGGVARLAAELVDLSATDHVVDIGSGPGAAARLASRRGATVTGVEPSSEMRSLAALLTLGRPSVRWVDGRAEALPLPDEYASVIWSLSTVHHWPDLAAGLGEVRRVLRPSGRFLAVERRTQGGARGHASHGWTVEQADLFAERCRAAGMRAVASGRHRVGRGEVVYVLAAAPA